MNVEIADANVAVSDGVLSAEIQLVDPIEDADEFDVKVPAALRMKELFARRRCRSPAKTPSMARPLPHTAFMPI